MAFLVWLSLGPSLTQEQAPRLALVHPTPEVVSMAESANPGTLIPGSARPSNHPGSWPQFRGPGRNNVTRSTTVTLARSWPESGPPVLWRIAVGEGHAGAAIDRGRVYLVDYDRQREEDAIRCLSLDTGEEIWRYTYSVVVKRNHGMSRTVPAVAGGYVLTLGPKCHVHCLDAKTGKMAWRKDLVVEHGTHVPLWYAGQCPLIDDGRAILAPGGKPLMMAVDLTSGTILWEANAPGISGMTHSSIVPIEFNGRRQYVYCAADGVVSVAADDGTVLWTHPDWRIKNANVPTPLPLGYNRIFFCGGYGAGSLMLRLVAEDGKIRTEEVFRLGPDVFGSENQTPILYDGHIYGVEPRPKAEMICLSLEGKRVWASGVEARFELGPYLICDGLLLAVDGRRGFLHMIQTGPWGYREVARAQLLEGHDAWGPLAIAEGRLILRDLTEMICVDLSKQ